jgi:prepilin peptidase CpaA
MIASLIITAVLPVLLAYACFSDLFTMRISNRLCLFVFGLFPIAAVAAGMPAMAIGMHVLAGFAVLAVSFTLFACGWIGGGDAKFVAAAASWFGFELLLEYLALFCMLGGLLTFGLLALRRHPLPGGLMQHGWISHLHHNQTGIPYGIALGIAALALLPQTAVWRLAF